MNISVPVLHHSDGISLLQTGFQQGWEDTPHYAEVWRVDHGDEGTGFDVKP